MAADPRQFTEHNNVGGANVYLEDKRMEELKSATGKTASQISTSAQYIPLQDVDGNLVKINPASFEEAVRNVLGSLLANNDKGTTISGVPALSGSGANLDFGSITPANLASVLGALGRGLGYEFSSNITSFDDIPHGIFLLTKDSSSFSNSPRSGDLRGFVLCFKILGSNIYSTQIYVDGQYQEIYFRCRSTSSGWASWKKLAFVS